MAKVYVVISHEKNSYEVRVFAAQEDAHDVLSNPGYLWHYGAWCEIEGIEGSLELPAVEHGAFCEVPNGSGLARVQGDGDSIRVMLISNVSPDGMSHNVSEFVLTPQILFAIDQIRYKIKAKENAPEFCETCQGKGWKVSNVGEPGCPLGEIACCDDCQARRGEVDDKPAIVKAIKAGYAVEEQNGHFVVTRGPSDDSVRAIDCHNCGEFHLIEHMITVRRPSVPFLAYYCDCCFDGVRTAQPF